MSDVDAEPVEKDAFLAAVAELNAETDGYAHSWLIGWLQEDLDDQQRGNALRAVREFVGEWARLVPLAGGPSAVISPTVATARALTIDEV